MNNNNYNNNNNNDNDKYLTNDIEGQNFIIDGEYLENKEVNTNYDNDANSPLERFKKSNPLFELNSSNSFRKSQSFPNDLLWTNRLKNKYSNNTTDIELVKISMNPLVNFNSNHNADEVNDVNDIDEESGLIIETTCNINDYVKSSYFSQIYNWFGLNKISVKTEMLNKFISIFLHIFIMVIFEIYFYFNFVVDIEKEQFLEKIQQYIDEFIHNINLDQTQKMLIYKLVGDKYDNTLITQLYEMYTKSLKQQKKLLHSLMFKSCKIAGIIGIVLIGLIGFGLFKKYKIKWKWIWVENFLMFALLGIFEYWFFINVVLNYNPITDAEIKYFVANQFINYFNSTI